jgi:hypothetical protein
MMMMMAADAYVTACMTRFWCMYTVRTYVENEQKGRLSVLTESSTARQMQHVTVAHM